MRLAIVCVVLVVLASVVLQAGCGPSIGHSAVEREHNWSRAFEVDLQAMNHDIDVWLMTDRTTRLSKWRTN